MMVSEAIQVSLDTKEDCSKMHSFIAGKAAIGRYSDVFAAYCSQAQISRSLNPDGRDYAKLVPQSDGKARWKSLPEQELDYFISAVLIINLQWGIFQKVERGRFAD